MPRKAGAIGAPGREPDAETRILDAARRVFMRRGTAGARMQEIAAEAGVNQALLHYYFGSKAELAERIFMEAAATVVQSLSPMVSQNLSFEESLERFVTSYIDAVRRTPFIPGYLVAEAHQDPDRITALMKKALGVVPAQVAAAMQGRIGAIVAERVAAGTMRPISPRQLLVNVIALSAMPFVARPLLGVVFGLDDAAYEAFLDERRRELPAFILNALRP
jgi:AcrR family transcriptional regulator